MNQFGWLCREMHGHPPICRVQGSGGSGAVRFVGILRCGSTACPHVTCQYPDSASSCDNDRRGFAFANRRSANPHIYRDRRPTFAHSRSAVVLTVGRGNPPGAA